MEPLTRDQWVRAIAVGESYPEAAIGRVFARMAREGLRLYDELERQKVSA